MPPLQELLAAQQALAVQMAEHELPLFEAARDALTAQPVTDLVAALTGVRDQLPAGTVNTQLGNVLIVLASVPAVLTDELQRVSAMLTPPAGPPGNGMPE